VLAVFAKPLLTAWVGPEIAARSAPVAAILAVGGLIHGLAQPPFHLLQAAGRPDIPARLHLVEAPLYVGYLLWLTAHFGITGTAAAWLLRVSISVVALGWLARRFVLDQPGSEQGPAEAVQ
jgi:O-antigen/teichoic acid export membrane protein